MRTKFYSIAFAILTASAVSAADTITRTTTVKEDGSTETTITTTTGTITEYVPGTTFIVTETNGPVNYRYGPKVTYITKSGKRISEEAVKMRLRVGLPVSVRYIVDGDNRVISSVVVDD